jgi:hypothetical protein
LFQGVEVIATFDLLLQNLQVGGWELRKQE